MAIVIVGANADHRDPGVHGAKEGTFEIRAAVVRNLQHVGAEVGVRAHEVLLRVNLGVAGHQDAPAPHLRPQYQRRVVRVRPSAAERHR
ncbi:MAG TPA: hypothetical protein VHI14_09170, partial [Jatrophihabitantaceae bacterium]|nr:hypothetical protein [Jatrophihabitantaceae bacterium]